MSYKIPVKNPPLRTTERVLGSAAEYRNTYLHPVFLTYKPSTVAVYNVATTDATWTRIPTAGTTLTNVVYWKLTERDGNDFYYAYEAAPSAFVTGFGYVSFNTEISAIWVQRPAGDNINMQLEIFS